MRKLMRKGIAFALSFVLAMSDTVIPNNEAKDVDAATAYQLVWSDEFEGTSLDTSVWNVEVNGDGGGNNELQYYVNDADNINVSDGTLKITALNESYNGKNYTSGRINTMGKKSFKYGRIEAKMKLPSFDGIWPAFWMLGENYSTDGWPACGEIDIMEAINGESTIYGTAHWAYNGAETNNGGNITGVDRTVWHTYAIEWTESEIKWYMDDTNYYTLAIEDSRQMSEFQAEQFIIFNLAVGGNWPGFSVDNTCFPDESTMEVDYVRVYQNVEVADMEYQPATRDDNFNAYGNWTVYVASSWANSTAQVAVDPTNADHIMIQQLTSDWTNAWSLQTRYTMTGLTPGEVYEISVDLTSNSADGTYMTDAADNQQIALAVGTTTVTRTVAADANGEAYITFGLGWVGLSTELDFSNVRCYKEGETPTQETTTAAPDEMSFETAIRDDKFNPYGNWTVYVASTWANSTAQVAVDPEDSDHIKLKQLTSDWSNAWSLQAQYVKSGLTPGETYVLSVDLKASTTNGSYLTDAIETETPIALTTTTTTVKRTAVADDKGEVAITFGFGYVGISNILELDNVICYLESEAPTEAPTEAPVDMEFVTATKDDNFHAYGNWQVFVASTWGGSTAQVAVDPTDDNHIQVKPTASDWSGAWAVQAHYVMSGLTPGEKYALSVEMSAASLDGTYLTDAIEGETPLSLTTEPTVITRIATADAEGKVAITFGLGWVGIGNIVDFDNVTCKLASEEETTTAEPEEGFESVISDNNYNPYGNWKLYVGSGWGGSAAEVAVDADDANHIKVKPTASDWSDAWTLQALYEVTGLTPGATYALSVDMFAKTDDGGYLTDAIEQEEAIALTTEATTVTRTCVADNDGKITITFGLGWVGIGNVVDFSNVVYEMVSAPTKPAVSVTGFQISKTQNGSRVLYNIDESTSTLDVQSVGLIYGLGGYATEDEMTISTTGDYVKAYEATTLGLISQTEGVSSYVMTMRMNIGSISVEGLSANYMVRAYALLSDGSYVYSDVETYSLYSIADVLYREQGMNTEDGHNYLYTNILYPVNKDYLPIEFDASNSIV